MKPSFIQDMRKGALLLLDAYLAPKKSWKAAMIFALIALPASALAAALLAFLCDFGGHMLKTGLIGDFFTTDFLRYFLSFYDGLAPAVIGAYMLYCYRKKHSPPPETNLQADNSGLSAYAVFIVIALLIYVIAGELIPEREAIISSFSETDYLYRLKGRLWWWLARVRTELAPIAWIAVIFLVTQFYLAGRLDRAYFKKFGRYLPVCFILTLILLAALNQVVLLVRLLSVDLVNSFYTSDFALSLPELFLQFCLYTVLLLGMSVIFTLPQTMLPGPAESTETYKPEH